LSVFGGGKFGALVFTVMVEAAGTLRLVSVKRHYG